MKTSFWAALAALPFVFGNPFTFTSKGSPNSATGLGLPRRDITQMSIGLCNVCFTSCDPEAGCDQGCDQTHYAVFGGGGQSPSCNDPSIPLDDDNCSASGDIPTPLGDGMWIAGTNCGDRTDGAYNGCIIAHDSSWVCTCFAFSGDYNEFCGQEYVCQNTYTCECSTCANNDCGTCVR